jgi:hypothetical protein
MCIYTQIVNYNYNLKFKGFKFQNNKCKNLRLQTVDCTDTEVIFE